MKPVIRKIIVFSTLPAAVAFLYWHLSSGLIENRAEITTAETPRPATPRLHAAAGTIDMTAYAEAGWGRDPFVRDIISDSLAPVVDEKPQWILGGILYDDKSPSAVINRKIVGPGDIINGAKVVKIKRQSVTLEIDSVAFTLDMARGKS